MHLSRCRCDSEHAEGGCGGGTERAGGFGLLEAAPGVMNESARSAEYDDGVDSVDERSEQGCEWTVQLVVIR